MVEEKVYEKPLPENPPYFTFTKVRFRGDPEYRIIGKHVMPKDGLEKASGTARYPSDVKLPGMLYAMWLTSPFPHVIAKDVDVSLARTTPGVVDIITFKDDPNLATRPVFQQPWHYYVLPREACWEGQPWAVAVCAKTVEACYEALKRVNVDYEVLPFVLDQREALKPNAPIARRDVRQNDNVMRIPIPKHQRGNLDKGFREADKTIEFELYCPPHIWGGTEPWATVVWIHGDYMDIWVRQQIPGYVVGAAAFFAGIAMDNVRVHSLYQGAVFGGVHWSGASIIPAMLAAIFARRNRKPVMVLAPWTNWFGIVCEEYGYMKFRIGAKSSGLITAVQIDSNMRHVPGGGAPGHEKLYEATCIENMDFNDTAAWVNLPPQVCYRHGTSETIPMAEVINRTAAMLGLDPTEVALKNDGHFGKPMHPDQDLEKERYGFPVRDSLKECIEEGKKAIGWNEKWHPPGARKLANGKYHGLGFTWCMTWRSGPLSMPSFGGRHVSAIIKQNGTALILGMRSCVGLHEKTTYCQIFAEESGIKYSDVEIDAEESQTCEIQPPAGSGGLSVNAVFLKALGMKVKRKILEAAAEHFGKSAEELDVQESEVFEKANPGNKITLAQLCSRYAAKFAEAISAHGDELVTKVDAAGLIGEEAEAPRWGRQAAFIEIEVDPDTGEIQIDKLVIVHDAGTVINPGSYAGQEYGGGLMGLEKAWLLENIYDPTTGVMLNNTYERYPAFTIADAVFPIDCIGIETRLGWSAYKQFGIGEDVGCLVRDVLRFAVHNAIGKWIDNDPITPDKILKALGKV